MWVRCAVAGLVGVMMVAGCGEKPREKAHVVPGVRVVEGGKKIGTVKEYEAEVMQEVAEEEGLRKPGVGRLVAGVRMLAGCESESGRAYARALGRMLEAEGIRVGRMPGKGKEGVTVEELARIDRVTIWMVGGSRKGGQGPVEAGKETIPLRVHLRLEEVVARECPGEYGALVGVMGTTNPLPGDVAKDARLTEAELRVRYERTWRGAMARFGDQGRPVTMSSAMAGAGGMLWAYVFYYAGNVLADGEGAVTGHELTDMAEGVVRIQKVMGERDAAYAKQVEDNGGAEGVRKFARIIQDNVGIAREAKGDLQRFFAAIGAGDDETVRKYSENLEKRTAAAWREYFGMDHGQEAKGRLKPEVVGVGVTENPGRIGVAVKTTYEGGKVSTEQHYVTVKKVGGRWVVVEG